MCSKAAAETIQNLANQHSVRWDSSELADLLDTHDELAHFRSKFSVPRNEQLPDCDSTLAVPEEECVYLCGNSLGLMPKKALEKVTQEMEKWAAMGVHGHMHGEMPWAHIEFATDKGLAKVLGAKPIEVKAMGSLTVNLHLMMVPFYKPTPTRHKILMEGKSFSSDFVAVQSQIRFHGFDPETSLLQIEPKQDSETLQTQDILDVIEKEGDSIALILFAGVQYYTGQLFDMKAITAAGHKKGCIVAFDLAHAVGNVPMSLHDWDVDFACWCSYKYLNCGPGAMAGLFVHERYATNYSLDRFSGWWGQDPKTKFSMPHDSNLQSGAAGFQISNQNVWSAACLVASLEIFDEVGMDVLRRKSLLLTGYMELILQRLFTKDQLKIITPSSPEERGCQLSLCFPGFQVDEMSKELDACGVVHDLRRPSVIRIAPVPLYNSFRDVHKFSTLVKSSYERLMKA